MVVSRAEIGKFKETDRHHFEHALSAGHRFLDTCPQFHGAGTGKDEFYREVHIIQTLHEQTSIFLQLDFIDEYIGFSVHGRRSDQVKQGCLGCHDQGVGFVVEVQENNRQALAGKMAGHLLHQRGFTDLARAGDHGDFRCREVA